MNIPQISFFTNEDKLTHIAGITDYPLDVSNEGWLSGSFYNCKLLSVFQPIFDIIENKTIGHTAYTRSESKGGITHTPWHIFALSSEDKQMIHLDRLCRTIHALNYFTNTVDNTSKLFVNVQPRLLGSIKDNHGEAFEHVLDLIDVPASRVVIEIPEEINRDWKLLRRVINNYRSRGYQIATNYSNASNDWALALMVELGGLYPDIMRIPIRDLLQNNNATALIKTIHRFGAVVLAHDIETSLQVADAIYAGVDYLQGNYLSKPAQALHTISPQLINETLLMNEIAYPDSGIMRKI